MIQLFLLLTAALAMVGLAVFFARSPSGATWVLVLVFITTEALISPLVVGMTVNGYSVYALDPIASIMLVVGVVGLVQRRYPRELSTPALALAALLVAHVAWGMATVGLQTAVTVARPWLYVVGPLVYATQATPAWTRASFRPIIVGGAALSAYVLFWIAQHGLKGANTFIDAGGQLLESRALTSVGVLLILQSLLIAVSAHFIRSPSWWWVVALMGGAVVLAEYRTVWLIALVAVVVAYVKWARVAIFTNERAALGAASAVLLLLPVAGALASSSSALGYSAGSSLGDNTSVTWRFDSWRGAIEAHHSVQDLVLGLPAGASIARRIGDQLTDRSVHSLYLDALLSFGVLGLAILVYFGIQIIRFRERASFALGISTTVVALIVVATGIFGITTMLGAPEGLLLGMLIQGAFLGGRGDPAPAAGRFARIPSLPGEL